MPPSDKNNDENATVARDEFEQVVDKLKSANNILVTISTNPTVDQFAACIGLTLILNKIGKHANAVFSGKAPSTLDFLKPEKTFEKDTDSLRDFIIALDKSKADKLRYKVEDEVVKIFITPYKTKISEKDLQYSQGDFNVDAIVALGVQDKHHIDSAILAHGRILHDAAVVSINTDKQSNLGTINWTDPRASSLCEMVADVASELDNKVFDSQNSTALLTGIVAETDRYSNAKAAPHTMSVAGLLMSAGASTQLVSSKLNEGPNGSLSPGSQNETDSADGVLEIEHAPETNSGSSAVKEAISENLPEEVLSEDFKAENSEPVPEENDNKPKVVHNPPELGGQLTANTIAEENRYSGSTDPLSNMPDIPVLNREDEEVSSDSLLPPSDGDQGMARGRDLKTNNDKTLTDIEKEVKSPHLETQEKETVTSGDSVEGARDAVLQARAELDGENDSRPEPRQDMGTTTLGDNVSGGLRPTGDTSDNNNNSPPPPVPPPLMPTAT